MVRSSHEIGSLERLLQVEGPSTARTLCQALRISQSTLSRLIADAGPVIERIGAARRTRYAARRSVHHHGDRWPIYRVDERGRPQVWGELRSLHGGFRFIPEEKTDPDWLEPEFRDGIFPGLPFFLQDARPQGYIGRSLARRISGRLGLPSDPERWNDDDILAYLVVEGSDLVGNLVVGDESLEQALREMETVGDDAIPEDQRGSVYPELATAAQDGEVVGSSAGGEQPKFAVNVLNAAGEPRSVLVKFTSVPVSPVSRRWADLLVCEHLAAETLSACGVACPRTRLLSAGQRRFLEVERFDRTPEAGRRGVVTLGAIEDAIIPMGSTNWNEAAGQFLDVAAVDSPTARELRWRWCFGNLIANTDMHRANTSFWMDDSLPFRLAPVYDMLPMLFSPGAQGDLGERTFSPRRPLPRIAEVWIDAAAAATEFWHRVRADERISAGFRDIASRCALEVSRVRERYG